MALRLYGDGNIENVTSINTSVSATELGYLDGIGGIGKVLQIVRATDTTLRSTSSDSMIDTGFQISITPSSASSNILLIWSVAIEFGGSNIDKRFVGQITDSANNAIDGTANSYFGTYNSSSLNSFRTGIMIGFDSPASTSEQTYKARYRVLNAGTTVYLANNRTPSQMYAIEVAP